MKRLLTRSFPKLQKAKGEPLWLILLGNYKSLIAALWVVAVIVWGVSELLPRNPNVAGRNSYPKPTNARDGLSLAVTPSDTSSMETISGEVLDMNCYVKYGAIGPKHARCATKCISSGLPVGIRAADGKVLLVVGHYELINTRLAALAAKRVTLKGMIYSRDGCDLIADAELVNEDR